MTCLQDFIDAFDEFLEQQVKLSEIFRVLTSLLLQKGFSVPDDALKKQLVLKLLAQIRPAYTVIHDKFVNPAYVSFHS